MLLALCLVLSGAPIHVVLLHRLSILPHRCFISLSVLKEPVSAGSPMKPGAVLIDRTDSDDDEVPPPPIFPYDMLNRGMEQVLHSRLLPG
jgi:hypothetical protein